MGINGIKALASCVLPAMQPCGTLLSQCDILKLDVCPGNGQEVLSNTAVLYRKDLIGTIYNNVVSMDMSFFTTGISYLWIGKRPCNNYTGLSILKPLPSVCGTVQVSLFYLHLIKK